MFSQDIAESKNRMVKDAFTSFTNRGGGSGGQASALLQAWQRVFLTFHVPIMVTGKPKKSICQNRKAWRGRDGGSESDSE